MVVACRRHLEVLSKLSWNSTFHYHICIQHENSAISRAFPVWQPAHLEDQNEEKNEENVQKYERNFGKMRTDWVNVHPASFGIERLAMTLHIKYVQISTNKPNIGLMVLEIAPHGSWQSIVEL